MRRALVVVSGLLVIAVAAVVLRYVAFFDPARWLFERTREKQAALLHAPEPKWPPDDAARRFHQGPGPCLRYASAEELGSKEEIAAALDELQGAALLENLDKHAPLLRLWSEEDERARHGAIGDEELLLLLSTEPSLGDRLALAFHAPELAALQRAKLEEHSEIVAAAAKKAGGRLPQTKRDVLEAIWTRHRDALAPEGRVLTHAAWKVRVSRVRLERIRAALESFHAVYAKCPNGLDDLDEKVAKTSLVDGFGRTFEYKRHDGGCRVTTLGLDGYPGGFGASEDAQIEVGLGAEAGAPGL